MITREAGQGPGIPGDHRGLPAIMLIAFAVLPDYDEWMRYGGRVKKELWVKKPRDGGAFGIKRQGCDIFSPTG